MSLLIRELEHIRKEQKDSMAQKNKQPSIKDVLQVPTFAFLWVSQILSQIAFNMLNFVLLLRVYQITTSNVAVSALVLSFMVPQLIVSLFAGVLVDRFEKKLVLLATNLVRAAVLLFVVLIKGQVVVFYLVAFAISTATQFFLPAEVAMIPKLVPKRLLLPANSLFTITIYGSIIIGYTLAGPSLKFLGATTTIFILAALFAAASFFNSLLPGGNGGVYLKNQIARLATITYRRIFTIIFNDIGEALYTILRSRSILLAILFLTMSQAVIVMLGALFPGYAATILGIDVEDSSLLLLAPAAFGMVIGSFFVARVGINVRKSRLVLPGVIGSGVMFLLLPFFARLTHSPTFVSIASVVAVFLLLGFFNAMIIIPSNIIIQERSAESLRGRIYAVFNGLSAFLSLIPVALAGYFSDIFGIGRVLTCIGIVTMLFGILPVIVRRREDI